MSDFRPKAVAFDLDGTLIDSLPGIEFSIEAAMRECDIRQKQIDLRSIIGPPIRVILQKIADTPNASIEELEYAFRRSYDSEGWSRTMVYAGTDLTLSRLHDAGLRLFVVTNKPQHVSMRIVEWTNIGHWFERIITRDSRDPHYLSKNEMLEFLLNSCAIERSDCLFVGDTAEDAQAAADCGIKFAHVDYGYGTISETLPLPVCFRTSKLSELADWIELELAHDR